MFRFLTLLTAIAVLAPSGSAAAQDRFWTIRGQGAYVWSSFDSAATTSTVTFPDGSGSSTITGSGLRVDAGPGFAVDAEYRISGRFAIQGSAVAGFHDSRLTFDVDSPPTPEMADFTLTNWQLQFGANVHLLPPMGRFDPYVGVYAARVIYGEGTVTLRGEDLKYNPGADTGWGLLAGLDVALNDRWLVVGGVRWTDTSTTWSMEMESRLSGGFQPIELDYNPVMASIGVGVRL